MFIRTSLLDPRRNISGDLRREAEGQARPTTPAASGFDLSRIPVHAQSGDASGDHSQQSDLTARAYARPFFSLRTSDADAGAGQQPTLPRGYGWTECKFPGGPSTTIFTSGCNKPCTELHEGVHLADIKSCCQQANVEYFLATSAAGKDRVRATWRRWADSARPATECRAYDVSNPCLDRLKDAKKCDGTAQNPEEKECCGEIKLARDDGESDWKNFKCASAPRELPSCPFGPSGP